ncbi:hypothetical protein [Methyloglobulus sp.]|uniref:hypothetical protein n=1 Tax=Methyloglobulus sp. TaxID=2518622 RepID=UPI0032B8334B
MDSNSFAYLRNRRVKFRVSDIYFPDPQEVVKDLYENKVLDGKVVDLSDSGKQEDAFVVVQVEGVKKFLIVPIDKVEEM